MCVGGREDWQRIRGSDAFTYNFMFDDSKRSRRCACWQQYGVITPGQGTATLPYMGSYQEAQNTTLPVTTL